MKSNFSKLNKKFYEKLKLQEFNCSSKQNKMSDASSKFKVKIKLWWFIQMCYKIDVKHFNKSLLQLFNNYLTQ